MSAIDSELRELATQKVTIAERSGTDKYGNDSYAASRTYDARVVYGAIQLQDQTGNRYTVPGGRAWVFGSPEVTADAQITLPDGSTPKIEAVESYPDDEGFAHVKVLFSVVRRR